MMFIEPFYFYLIFLISFFGFFKENWTNPLGGKIEAISFNLTVVHLNDFHARFEEVNYNSVTCANGESKCIGGIARVYTAVTRLLENNPNAIFVNAGDNFQGTLWYNIFKWNVTEQFLNKFPTDAYTIGNHEFDDAIAGLVPFLKSLNAPIVISNVDVTDEPEMLGLFNKSVVVEKNGIRVGIIGVILETTPTMAKTENVKFLPESASVNEEADRLVSENLVDTIIVVAHCGYSREIEIARNATSKIGLVVGAHSHTFLYTGKDHPGPDTPEGEYPTVVTHEDGRKILVVTASAYTKYLGDITIYYDLNGDVIDWEGAPILLDSTVQKDESMENELQPWKEVVDSYGGVLLGETLIPLTSGDCYDKECVMGNFIADSYAASYSGSSSALAKYPPLGFINPGGVRAALNIGNITYGDATQVQPFENTCDYGELKGEYLMQALRQTENSLLQVSGLRLNYTSSPLTLVSAEVYCSGCDPARYVPVNEDEYFVVVFASFFKSVGKFKPLYANISDYTIGEVDLTAFTQYITSVSPVRGVEMGRLNFKSKEDDEEENNDEEEENDEEETEQENNSGNFVISNIFFLISIVLINVQCEI